MRLISRSARRRSKTVPFQRGEFDGNPSVLPLKDSEKPYFDPTVLADQKGKLEQALLEDLAVAIAGGTFDTVLSGVS